MNNERLKPYQDFFAYMSNFRKQSKCDFHAILLEIHLIPHLSFCF